MLFLLYLFFLVLFFIAYVYTIELDEAFFVVFFPLFIFLVFPAIFLHIEYYKRNKGEVYKLCGNKIIRCKGEIEVIYNKEDPLLHDQIKVSLCYVRYNLNVFYNHRYLTERTKETIAKVQGANMEKLLTGKKARFSEGSYTDEAAKLRRDKNGED